MEELSWRNIQTSMTKRKEVIVIITLCVVIVGNIMDGQKNFATLAKKKSLKKKKRIFRSPKFGAW